MIVFSRSSGPGKIKTRDCSVRLFPSVHPHLSQRLQDFISSSTLLRCLQRLQSGGDGSIQPLQHLLLIRVRGGSQELLKGLKTDEKTWRGRVRKKAFSSAALRFRAWWMMTTFIYRTQHSCLGPTRKQAGTTFPKQVSWLSTFTCISLSFHSPLWHSGRLAVSEQLVAALLCTGPEGSSAGPVWWSEREENRTIKTRNSRQTTWGTCSFWMWCHHFRKKSHCWICWIIFLSPKLQCLLTDWLS